MDRLTQLNARLDRIIEFGNRAVLGDGRTHNPHYEPGVKQGAPRRIGQGKEEFIPVSRVVSSQATIHGAKVRSMKDKLNRGQKIKGSLPEVQRQGKRYLILDGNHRIAAHARAGRRMVKVLVQ